MDDLRVDADVVDGVSSVLREAAGRLPVTVTSWAEGCGSLAVERVAAELLSWVQVETGVRRAAVESLDAGLHTSTALWADADTALGRAAGRRVPL